MNSSSHVPTNIRALCQTSNGFFIGARFLAGWIWTLSYSAVTLLVGCLLGPTRMWTLMAKGWAQGTLAIVGVKLNIDGERRLKQPAVYICNHQSLVDVIILPAILPNTVRFIGKRSLAFIPIWGWVFATGGAILIDRRRAGSAREAIARGLKRLGEGWSVAVFPEGTRSKDGTLQPFKSGAFEIARQRGLPIIPIALHRAADVIGPGESVLKAATVTIVVGEPIAAHDDVQVTRQAAYRAVSACMQRAALVHAAAAHAASCVVDGSAYRVRHHERGQGMHQTNTRAATRQESSRVDAV